MTAATLVRQVLAAGADLRLVPDGIQIVRHSLLDAETVAAVRAHVNNVQALLQEWNTPLAGDAVRAAEQLLTQPKPRRKTGKRTGGRNAARL